jgi:hypothetical protein
MTHSELSKYRKIVPFAIFGLCIFPWFYLNSRNLEQAKLANDVIVSVIAFVATYLYLGSDVRRKRWDQELDAHVGKQIRSAVLRMIPKDLEVTEDEKHALEGTL